MTEKQFTFDNKSLLKDNEFWLDGQLATLCNAEEICHELNELHEENQKLLKYKYLTKALEEVSGSHYIEELIADFSDGAYCDDKEQIELGKWVVENGLSWEEVE